MDTAAAELIRVKQSNDIAHTIIEVAQDKEPGLFITLGLRYGIADALWDAGYRRVDPEPSKGGFCDQCSGPYPLDSWPGDQYAGHWDTCPNRHSSTPVAEPSDAEKPEGSDLMAPFQLDGAEGIAFWVDDVDDEEVSARVMFSDIPTLRAFLAHNFPNPFRRARPEPSDAEADAAGRGLYENRVSLIESEGLAASWPAWEGLEEDEADSWRDAGRAALKAAQEVRRG